MNRRNTTSQIDYSVTSNRCLSELRKESRKALRRAISRAIEIKANFEKYNLRDYSTNKLTIILGEKKDFQYIKLLNLFLLIKERSIFW